MIYIYIALGYEVTVAESVTANAIAKAKRASANQNGPGSNADRTGPDGPGCDDCDFGRSRVRIALSPRNSISIVCGPRLGRNSYGCSFSRFDTLECVGVT